MEYEILVKSLPTLTLKNCVKMIGEQRLQEMNLLVHEKVETMGTYALHKSIAATAALTEQGVFDNHEMIAMLGITVTAILEHASNEAKFKILSRLLKEGEAAVKRDLSG
jgi:hypothetical protein